MSSTDELRDEAVATTDDDAIDAADGAYKMSLGVDVATVGPCKRHVKVTVPRTDLDYFYEEAVGEFSGSADVPGFRKGHVPSKLIERRFRKELMDQVKQRVLVGSLEQISEEQKLDPINEPDLDVKTMEIPDEGDFVYEFDVEVRPEFDLPSYEGLKVERPVGEIGDADVDAYLTRFLQQYGELVPHDGPAEKRDHVVLSVRFSHDGRTLHEIEELNAQLQPTLRFTDAELTGFDDLFVGAGAGDRREADLTISPEAATVPMRGETVHAEMEVLDVKRHREPERTKEFFDRIGVASDEELRTEVRGILERQLAYQQRQTARRQVLDKITESADWDLPESLVSRQIENALHREILEMQQAGFTTQEIRARENELRQQAISTTRQALKEHFVLDRIAEEEKVEVTPEDVEFEIRLMAMQRGESPRRVKAKLVKSGVIENLEAQIRERKAVEAILARAQFVDVPAPPLVETGVEAVAQSVCVSVAGSVVPVSDEEAEDGDA